MVNEEFIFLLSQAENLFLHYLHYSSSAFSRFLLCIIFFISLTFIKYDIKIIVDKLRSNARKEHKKNVWKIFILFSDVHTVLAENISFYGAHFHIIVLGVDRQQTKEGM